MEQTKMVIENIIKEIFEQKFNRIPEIKDEFKLIDDLGFSSLDIAQLIAQLEMELGVDPFVEGASISSVRTVGSLFEVYQSSLRKCEGI